MPEAGWLLLFLFLGVCSLIVVALLWPSFRRAYPKDFRIANEAHTYTASSAASLIPTAPSPVQKETKAMTSRPVLPIAQWLPIVNDRPDEAPHTLVIGTSGTGKTTLAHALAAARSGKLAILDPKWTSGKWGGLPAVPIDDDGGYTQIEAAIKALLEELGTRLVSLKSGVSEFEDLSIIAEELPTLVDECPSASTLFKKIGRTGRELRIRLIGLSQSERVKSLGIAGEGDAKDNYTLIRLGKAALSVMPEARLLPRPALLEWRGDHHLIELEGLLRLAHLSIPSFRSWTPETGVQKQTHEQSLQQNDQESSDRLFLTFSAEELGKIAVMIIKGVERKQAIRAMPRYSRKQHKEFAAFFDQLKEAITASEKDE